MRADISLDTAHAALDFIFDTLKPPLARITLGITGEPLLGWDLIKDIVEYAHYRSEESYTGVSFHITTNGLEVDSELLDYLRDNDDMYVSLSWDGPPEIHNRQCPSADGVDTYERVSKAFEMLRSGARSGICVVATVTALNPDVAGIFTHLFDNGVRSLVIKPLRSVDPAVAVTRESLPAFKSAYAKLAEPAARTRSRSNGTSVHPS